MTIKSLVELLAQADATLPDNVTQDITAADVRQMIKDFIDSITPGYGAFDLATQAITLNPTTPTLIGPGTTQLAATPAYYTVNLSAAQVTRLIASAGAAGATDFVIGTGTVSGQNNNNVTVTLFRDGVATPYTTSVTCSGANDNVGFNIAGILYKAGADAVYELRATAPAGSYTFKTTNLIVQSQPVRTFV
jgi:hypothetical protein